MSMSATTTMNDKEGSKTLKIVSMKVSFFMSRDLKPQIGTFFGRRVIKRKIWVRLRKKRKGITITVYKHNRRLLNISGIRNLNHLEQTRKFVQEYYHSVNNSAPIGERIDNIMFSRKMFNNYDMPSILNVCRKLFSHSHHIQYDDQLLTSKGIFLKPRVKPNCSFILFRTGSSTIMGAKQISEIHQCQLMLDRIYQDCYLVKG